MKTHPRNGFCAPQCCVLQPSRRSFKDGVLEGMLLPLITANVVGGGALCTPVQVVSGAYRLGHHGGGSDDIMIQCQRMLWNNPPVTMCYM